LAEGWQRVLDQMTPTQRAVWREARPEREGSRLVLWFRFGWHHQQAGARAAELLPVVIDWLGPVEVDFRLQEAGATPPAPPPSPGSPEDHPLVQAIVSKFEGRVTRVREVKP